MWKTNRRKSSTREASVYIPFDEFCNIYEHCKSVAHEREVMGLLIGDIFSDDFGSYTTIFKPITGTSVGSSVHVQFLRKGIAELVQQLEHLRHNLKACPICGGSLIDYGCLACPYDIRNTKIVGWYHSHPGLRAFLSSTDVTTQLEYFDQPYNVAMVIDPIHSDLRIWQNVDSEIVETSLYGF